MHAIYYKTITTFLLVHNNILIMAIKFYLLLHIKYVVESMCCTIISDIILNLRL